MSGGVQRATEPALSNAADLGVTALKEIGRGATSTVYAARQEKYGRDVAIKVFSAPLVDDKARRRFERECKILGQLSVHPNVVNLYDSGFDDAGRPFIVMDNCERGSLQNQLATSGPMTIADVLRTGIKVSSALEFAHRSNVMHRDIKPANILRTAFGEPVLSDFGISGEVQVEVSWTIGESLTPLYAAPEVLEDGGGTTLSDIWSLGSTLYALLHGKAPFADTTSSLVALVNRIIRDPAPPLNRTDVPPTLLAVLNDAMAKAPADRPATAAAFASRLQQVQRELGVPVTEFVEIAADHRPVAEVPAEVPDARDGAPSMDVLPTTDGETVVRAGLAALATPVVPDTNTGPPQSPSDDIDIESAPTRVRRSLDEADAAATVLRARPALPPPGPPDNLLPAVPGRSRRRWALIALAVAVVVAVPTVLLTSRHHKATPPAEVAISLPAANVTGVRCDGYLCHFTVAAQNVPSGATLSVSFGDGTTTTESHASFAHRYKDLHSYTVNAVWTNGDKTGAAGNSEVALHSYARSARLTAANATSHHLRLRVKATPRCRAGGYELRRRAHGSWHRVGSVRHVGSTGTARVTVSTTGSYRVSLPARDTTGGRCAGATAGHTVSARRVHSAPTTATTTTSPTTTTTTTTTTHHTTSHPSQPIIKPTAGKPPPNH